MTKKQKNWERLPLFTDWADYEKLNTAELTELVRSWDQDIQAVRAEMSHAEIIVGRSNRAKHVNRSRAHCMLIQQRLIDQKGPSAEAVAQWGKTPQQE